jgi:hypothetical protein
MVLTKVANESLNGLPGAIGNWAEDTFKEPPLEFLLVLDR